MPHASNYNLHFENFFFRGLVRQNLWKGETPRNMEMKFFQIWIPSDYSAEIVYEIWGHNEDIELD